MAPRLGATLAVGILPVLVVWLLRAEGVIESPWVGVGLALVLALIATAAGNAYWKRKRHGSAGDVVFGDLMPWGWIRRRRAERRLANAVELLAGIETRDTAGRTRLMKQVAQALDAKDPYLEGHSFRVARSASITARRMKLPAEEVARVETAAAVHDVGKLHVPATILNKPVRLTEEEFEQIKRHSTEGAQMVECLGDPMLTAIVRHHHERFDGRGYPDGLRGDEIPLGAQIIAVADTFDAITAPRPYRAAAPHKRALDVLREESGGQLSPAAVDAFMGYYSGRRGILLWALLAAPAGRRQLVPLGVVAAVTAAVVALPFSRPIAHSRPHPTASYVSAPAPAKGLTGAAVTVPHRARRRHVKARRATIASPAIAVAAAAGAPRAAAPAVAPPTGSPPPPAPSPPVAASHQPAPPAPSPPAAGPAPTTAKRPPPAPTTTVPAPVPVPTTTSPPAPAPASPSTPAPVGTPAPPPPPSRPSKDACKHGGYIGLGYGNQGRCVSGH